MKRKSISLLIATLLGLLISSRVLAADHNLLERHADELACQMDELRDSFRQQFRYAANYSELRSTAWSIRGSAKRIERLAGSRRPGCGIEEELDAIGSCLRRLELNVAQARYRADAGLDPPLNGCTLHIDRKLAVACETFRCMRQSFGGGFIAVPVPTAGPWTRPIPWQAQRPAFPGCPSGGSVLPGMPVQPYPGSPYAEGPYADAPYSGSQPMPYHGNGIPTPAAPDWHPEHSIPNNAPYSVPHGELPSGGQFEEIGPPLSGGRYQTPRGNGSPVANTPIGLYGRRGNGVELSQGGIVLRVGGAAINLR